MKCAKCDGEMKKVTLRGVEIDRCRKCGGIFLDKGELETIDQADIGTLFDRGAYSRRKPDMDELPATCPHCQKPMMSFQAAGGVNIDWCEQCEGIFLDRGELAALDLFEDLD